MYTYKGFPKAGEPISDAEVFPRLGNPPPSLAAADLCIRLRSSQGEVGCPREGGASASEMVRLPSEKQDRLTQTNNFYRTSFNLVRNMI